MKLTLFTTAAALFIANVFASADDFPSFDIFHSHCKIDVVVNNQLCVDVYSKIISTLDSFNAGADPSGGQYQYKERQPISYIWMTHDSKRGWFSDVIFEAIQVDNGCQIQGRSRTQSTFHSAGIENYCDLWNVYEKVDPTFNGLSVSSCSATPKDPATNCKA